MQSTPSCLETSWNLEVMRTIDHFAESGPCHKHDYPSLPFSPIQVTRIASVGPADFLCGLSEGGVVRVRPGLAQPCLLAQSSSMLGLSFSTIRRMGVSDCCCCGFDGLFGG